MTADKKMNNGKHSDSSQKNKPEQDTPQKYEGSTPMKYAQKDQSDDRSNREVDHQRRSDEQGSDSKKFAKKI
jgi:hypothetical protein